ncbi:hypothetical protein FOA52_012404 [Chlamydomonas sp. UWO 241]|nr:hypothetical protein FOA52_012404 [Chlamydomonas sp. UWO 241]
MKDGWGAFETADIHRVNVRAPAKGAGYLIDNVQSATAAPTVWEWTVQSEAAKGAQPSEARVDQYPPNMQRKSADPVAMGKKRALVVPALERMSAGDAAPAAWALMTPLDPPPPHTHTTTLFPKAHFPTPQDDSSGRGNLSRGASLDSPLQPTLGEIFLPYSA